MPSAEIMPGRCGARVDGGYCTQWPIRGTRRCRSHPGMPLEKARAKGNVVVELARWGLGDTTVDPGEVLLRLVTQSAARVELYSRLLEEAYDAAERLRQAHEVDDIVLVEAEDRPAFGDHDSPRPEHASRQTARADLERIFATGGVAALIGHQYGATKNGDVYATGEAIRGLAKLEAEERDRCAAMAAKAVAAGLAERQVRLAEQQGVQMAGVFRRVLDALGLSAEQRALVPELLRREIAALTGGLIIEGGTA
jgi:hypothetical protein